MAGSQSPIVLGFALFSCHTQAASLRRNGSLEHLQK